MISSLIHQSLLLYPVQVTLCSALFWLFFKLVVEPSNHLSFSRTFLLLSLAAPIIIPLLSIPVYTTAPVFMDTMNVAPWEAATVQTSAAHTWNIPLYTYLLITTLLFIRLCLQLLALHKLTLSGIVEQNGSSRVVCSTKVYAPCSFLHTIFLPKSINSSEKEIFLLHESAHIRNRHSFDILFSEVLIIFFWFNPIFWLTKGAIKNIHEYQADGAVRTSLQNICLYKTLIVKEFLGSSPSICHTFNHSFTKKRIIMLTKPIHTKFAALRMALAIPFIVLNLALFSFTSRAEVRLIDPPLMEISGTTTQPLTAIQDTTKAEVTYTMVEEKPQFQGGDEFTFQKWVNEQLVYPVAAMKDSIQGRVTLSFVIDSEGNLRDIAIIKGVGPVLDKEAIRVISSSPKWTPGKEKGKPVSVRYTFPIIFKLN